MSVLKVPKGYKKYAGKIKGEKESFLVQAVDAEGDMYGPIECLVTGKVFNGANISLIEKGGSDKKAKEDK